MAAGVAWGLASAVLLAACSTTGGPARHESPTGSEGSAIPERPASSAPLKASHPGPEPRPAVESRPRPAPEPGPAGDALPRPGPEEPSREEPAQAIRSSAAGSAGPAEPRPLAGPAAGNVAGAEPSATGHFPPGRSHAPVGSPSAASRQSPVASPAERPVGAVERVAPPPALLYPPPGRETEVSTLSPLIEWTDPGGRLGEYQLELSPLDGGGAAGPARVLEASSATRIRLRRALAPGQAYRLRVRAKAPRTGVPGSWSEPAVLRLPPPGAEPMAVRPLLGDPSVEETAPAPAPGGGALAFLGAFPGSAPDSPGASRARVYTAVLEPGPGGAPEAAFPAPVLLAELFAAGPPAWLPDGQGGFRTSFAAGGGGGAALLYAVGAEGAAVARGAVAAGEPGSPGEAWGTPLLLGGGIPSALARPSPAPGGRIYFEAPEGGGIWSVRADGSERVLVAEGSHPQVSPDGRLLAFVSEQGGGPDVWLLRLGGPGSMKPLLRRGNGGGRVETPAWSPRMDSIVFASDLAGPGDVRGASLDLLRVEIESGEVRALTRSPADDRDPAFLPGTAGGAPERILFSSDRAGSFDLYVLELER